MTHGAVVGALDSPVDLALLLLLALLLFGAKRLPEIARSLGTGMREFKDSVSGMTHEEPSAPQLAAATPISESATPSGASAAEPTDSAPVANPRAEDN
jgi:sec-independent protein translocase protein TatA